ncbi:swr1 complex component [Geranomyces variabilis]|nr:swr1 complex component [Geranomyces variabilis]
MLVEGKRKRKAKTLALPGEEDDDDNRNDVKPMQPFVPPPPAQKRGPGRPKKVRLLLPHQDDEVVAAPAAPATSSSSKLLPSPALKGTRASTRAAAALLAQPDEPLLPPPHAGRGGRRGRGARVAAALPATSHVAAAGVRPKSGRGSRGGALAAPRVKREPGLPAIGNHPVPPSTRGRGGRGRGRGAKASAGPPTSDGHPPAARTGVVARFWFPDWPGAVSRGDDDQLSSDSDSDSAPLTARQQILSGVDVQKRNLLEEKKHRLRMILDNYDTHMREMYYLEHNLPLLEFDAARLKLDKGERIVNYLQAADLRNTAAQNLAAEAFRQQTERRKSGRYGTRGVSNRQVNSMESLVESAIVAVDALIPRSEIHDRGATRYADLDEYLASFLVLDDEEVTREAFRVRAEKEAAVEARIAEYRRAGLLTGVTARHLERRQEPAQKTHWSRVLDEMTAVSGGFAHAGKERARLIKAIKKDVERYWELRLSAGERVAQAQERKWMRAYKDVRVELTKRWKLVESIVKVNHSKLIAQEQRQAGMRQLDAMIEHSSSVLQNRHVESVSRSPSIMSAATFESDDFSLNGDDDGDVDIETDSHSDQSEMDALHQEKEIPVEELIGSGYFSYQFDEGGGESAAGDTGEDEEEDGVIDDEEDEELDRPNRLPFDCREGASTPVSNPASDEPETHLYNGRDSPMVGSPIAVANEVDGDDEFQFPADDDSDGDNDAENELDREELLEETDSDEEMRGLQDDMGMDVDALRDWMRKMDEEAAEREGENEDQESAEDTEEEEELGLSEDEGQPDQNGHLSQDDESEATKLSGPPTRGNSLENGDRKNGVPTLDANTSATAKDPLQQTSDAISMDVDPPAALGGLAGDSEDSRAIPPSSSVLTDSPPALNGAPSSPSPSITVETPPSVKVAPVSPSTPVPFLLKHSLREYQHAGLDWLAGLYQNGLNGILADEMGLGKTIQTIALFAHLAVEKGVWGPHLIVVPTSVMLNWECEFKKWLPGFKLLTYYGNIAERAAKRVGWQRPNAFHVCITSYQIVLRDQHIFRRKRWCYLVLDEAHNIKNFRSQRWQTLLGFNTERRLLLTGTPLQNSLMELWSLLYFLMPADTGEENNGFAGRNEFKEWFEGSVSQLIGDGSSLMASNMADPETRASVGRLHAVLRPYILRRLKADVEKQMPGKHEHVVKCRLSKRQRFLYDDFMSRAKTKEDLASGNYLSIVNVLMQLRKVCNHPNLFEERPVVTGLALHEGGVAFEVMGSTETLAVRRLLRNLDDEIDLARVGLRVVNVDHEGEHGWSAFDSETLQCLNVADAIDAALGDAVTAEIEARGLLPRRDSDGKVWYSTVEQYTRVRRWREARNDAAAWRRLAHQNRVRCAVPTPMYTRGVAYACRQLGRREVDCIISTSEDRRRMGATSVVLRDAVKTPLERAEALRDTIDRFACVTPRARAHPFRIIADGGPGEADGFDRPHGSLPDVAAFAAELEHVCPDDVLSHAKTRLEISFPDKRLVQFDCGKLQTLDRLLREFRAGGHRALIFTQMTKMLDILEVFLNLHGHRYLRLDGSTKVEQRQVLMERFNNDKRILAFILSTRSGGVGMNLTGADAVVFFDSDWNPAMDAQAQDRAHRIGQTREVHIYRLVCEHTVEENMLRKANQKRQLDRVVIQAGDFTTEWMQKEGSGGGGAWKDWLDPAMAVAAAAADSGGSWEQAITQAEDETDVIALRRAQTEMDRDVAEFAETEDTERGGGCAILPLASVSTTTTASRATEAEFVDGGTGGNATASDQVAVWRPAPNSLRVGPLDEYLFRLVIHRMGLTHALAEWNFAEELNEVAG